MAYESKSSAVSGRQMLVQELAIPFTITSSGAAVTAQGSDEPSILFIKTQGIDDIAARLTALGDTATYTGAAISDANGVCTFYIDLDGEACSKVVSAYVISRTTGVVQPVFLGSATGISSLGNIMLKLDSAVNHATTSVDAALIVKYIV